MVLVEETRVHTRTGTPSPPPSPLVNSSLLPFSDTHSFTDEKLAREFGSMVTDISEGGSDAGGEEALLDSVAEAAEAEAEAAEAEVDTENQVRVGKPRVCVCNS